jgi:WD40 repeat protein
VIDTASSQVQSSFKITAPGSRPAAALKLVTGRRPFVTVMAFGWGGRLLATGHWDGNVQLWDTGTGQYRLTLKHERVNKHNERIVAVALSPDGDRLVTANPDGARLWDLAKSRQVGTFGDRASGTHTSLIKAITFAPDGRLFATGDYGENVRLWDSNTGKHLHAFPVESTQTPFWSPSVTDMAFTRDGNQLAVARCPSDLARHEPVPAQPGDRTRRSRQ